MFQGFSKFVALIFCVKSCVSFLHPNKAGNRKIINSLLFSTQDLFDLQRIPYEHSIGDYKIFSSTDSEKYSLHNGQIGKSQSIVLKNMEKGFGSGAHPTTKLCLEFLHENVKDNMKILDYGTGSGILSIYAAKIGAIKCLGVDVDDDALEVAKCNCFLNDVDSIVDIMHTKDFYVGDEDIPLFDLTIANIFAGPLTRLVGPICGQTKPGGFICLSGMRPHELAAVKRFYDPFVILDTETVAVATHPVYGEWVRWTVKIRNMSKVEKINAMNSLMDAGLQ